MQQILDLKNTLAAELGYVLLLFLPPAAVVFNFYRRQKREQQELEMPFGELPRRPAGETNRLKVEQLNEQIDPWLIGFATIPVLLALALALQKPGIVAGIIGFMAVAIYSAIAQRKLSRLLKDRAAYRLGFHGERCVAEELNQLMREGFEIFHDIPFDKYNIDHVLVGPTGVFVVETKTKRKRTAHGKKKHKVSFDGARLNFPGSWDTAALEQARLNAKTLSQWLSSATADRITAHAVLTIPGWYVERSAGSDVYVTNPKQIRPFVLSSTEKPLTPAEIQRVVHQLEQKCKLQRE